MARFTLSRTPGVYLIHFLIVASVMGAGLTIATFSQALLEFEFGKVFGRRRMERELARLSDHYIICGAGRVAALWCGSFALAARIA